MILTKQLEKEHWIQDQINMQLKGSRKKRLIPATATVTYSAAYLPSEM